MIDINLTSIPKYFKFCLRDDCPLAEKCLRHEAAAVVIENNVRSLTVLNPKLMAEEKENCKEYISTEPKKCGKGFLKFLSNLSVSENKRIASLLESACSSQRQYYRIRNGEKLVSPEEQEELQKFLKSKGADVTITFDEIVNEYIFTSSNSK